MTYTIKVLVQQSEVLSWIGNNRLFTESDDMVCPYLSSLTQSGLELRLIPKIFVRSVWPLLVHHKCPIKIFELKLFLGQGFVVLSGQSWAPGSIIVLHLCTILLRQSIWHFLCMMTQRMVWKETALHFSASLQTAIASQVKVLFHCWHGICQYSAIQAISQPINRQGNT